MTTTVDIPAPRSGARAPIEPLNGEITEAFGLVIIPAAYGGRYTGLWTIMQTSTRAPATNAMTLAYAREFATVLARTGLDWERPASELAAEPRHRDLMDHALGELQVAQWMRRPLWWARSSWTTHAPMWSVLDTAATPPQLYSTDFAGMWQLVEQLPSAATHYDPRPVWSLRCAAPLCIDGYQGDACEVLTDDGSNVGDPMPLRAPGRGALIAAAEATGWACRDRQHWLCPACVLAHTDDID